MKPHYFLLYMLLFCFIGCDKDADALYPDPFHPDQEQFRSSMFIEVFNANGQPIPNALIRIGNFNRVTDSRGFLYLKDVLVGATTYLVAEKDGYFHASRRFYPTKDSQQYIKLIMLSDAEAASFSAGSGADVPIDGGITLRFPKDGYEYLNGEGYNGNVVVAAKAITADDPDLSYKMPGDLTGVNAQGELGSLGSFGMMGVELRSSSGSRLRLKSGVQVDIDMMVPASQLATAPSTIPMWYFDEEAGIWKEEGSATLTGNKYTASVSHFSYWNLDAWFPAIKWGATFDFGNLGPAAQVDVCITIISLNTTKCAYTNTAGMVCGLVAANELLLMEVTNLCGEVIYAEQIGPFSDSTMLGPITLSGPGIKTSTILGLGINCDGGPVTDGYALIKMDYWNQYSPLDVVTGAFSAVRSTCYEADITINLIDLGNNKLSQPKTFEFAPLIDAGSIQVCETNYEFIDIKVEGFTEHLVCNFPGMDYNRGPGFAIYNLDSLPLFVHSFFVSIPAEDEGVFISKYGYIDVTLPNGVKAFVFEESPLKVEITQYGEVGDYILGKITGKLQSGGTGGGGPLLEYPFVATFSVFREF